MTADPRADLHVLGAEQAPAPNGHHRKAEKPPRTEYPNWILDMLGDLSSAERDALTYIVRRTYGFGEKAWTGDTISYSQFKEGTRSTKDGRLLDKGSGIKSNATLIKALAGLQRRGLIAITPHDGRTSHYRIIPPTPSEIEEVAPAAAHATPSETEEVPLQKMKTTPSENEDHPFRNWRGTPSETEDTKERGKKGTKESFKESAKESSLLRADARPREPQGEASVSSGDAEADSGVRLSREPLPASPSATEGSRTREARSERSERCAAEAHPSFQVDVPNCVTAGPRGDKTKGKIAGAHDDKIKDKTERTSNEPVGDEADDLWAALELLRVVFARKNSAASVKDYWRKAAAPHVAQEGGRAQWARFCRYMEDDGYVHGIGRDGAANILKLNAAWLDKEYDYWESLPEPKPENKAFKARGDRQRRDLRDRQKEHAARRGVHDNTVTLDPEDEVYNCLVCRADPGQPHYDWCGVLTWAGLAPGAPVVADHCDVHWVLACKRAHDAAHPPVPKPKVPEPPPDERPACCDPRCGARLGDAHSAACVTAKAVGLSPGAPVSAQHCDRAQVAALARAHGEEVNARGREMAREMAQKLKRDRPPRFAPAPLSVATATDDDG